MEMGALRADIDLLRGIAILFMVEAHIGSELKVGGVWATVYHRVELEPSLREWMQDTLTLSTEPVEPSSRIIDILC
jgi:hypothetical protein